MLYNLALSLQSETHNSKERATKVSYDSGCLYADLAAVKTYPLTDVKSDFSLQGEQIVTKHI
jgi:hypothetical protein